jgi:hypothetical protein
MEYDHQCVCGHREKDHLQVPEHVRAKRRRPCNVCSCKDYKGTNIVSLEKGE